MDPQHNETLALIRQARLIAILRNVPMDRLDGVVDALISGGVRVLEFTFDHDRPNYLQENADKIRYTVEHYGEQVTVGCGTALSVDEVNAAHGAGARLVISPDVNPAVIHRARELDMVSMPGALTPTEIVTAWNAGADIVKLFPAGELGLGADEEEEFAYFGLEHDDKGDESDAHDAAEDLAAETHVEHVEDAPGYVEDEHGPEDAYDVGAFEESIELIYEGCNHQDVEHID